MTPIDIRPADLETVRRILQEHVPNLEVHAFGSRVAWNARETSDLDLALMTDEPLSIDRSAKLRAAFTDSDLPFRVDIVDWARTSEAFRKVIEAEYVVLCCKGRSSSADWVRLNLADACSAIDYGLTASASNQRSGPRFLRITDIVSGQIDWNAVPYVAAANSNVEKYKLHDGDIVVALTGASTGASAYIKNPPRAVFASYLVRLRAKPDFSSRFLAYVLKSEAFWEYIRGVLGDKSAQPNASASTMTAAPIRVPRDKAEQRAIAQILGTLDDKIELNRRMNATLEAMAQALFKSWFVDFDPVRAKMEGRDTGLPKEVADLFPDRLACSELGEIPEGWMVSEIGEEVDAVGGATPSTKESRYWNGQHNWATPKDLSKLLSPVLLNTDRSITDAGVGKISSGLLPQGTVLLSSRAPIGYLAITAVPTAVNQGFIAMICRRRLPAMYVLSWCYENLEHIKDISGGSTFAEISKKTFRPLPVVVPPKKVLGVYDEASRLLHGRVVSNTRESALLASLRDTLLPKLVSGELRVQDDERLVKAVASRDVACRLRPTELT